MIGIEILEAFETQIERALIERAAETTLTRSTDQQDTSLTILVTDDQQIHELNLQYRDVDAPTDVLSFPAGYIDPEDGTTYLGDVIISYSQAAIQAEQGKHTVEDELQLLVIHGILHLLGYDHTEPPEKQKMWKLQGEILNQLGISIQFLDDA